MLLKNVAGRIGSNMLIFGETLRRLKFSFSNYNLNEAKPRSARITHEYSKEVVNKRRRYVAAYVMPAI